MREGGHKINMELKSKINGKVYYPAQGCTFKEEYNETLDSGTIILAQVPNKINLKPYDDVYIYDNDFIGHPYEEEEIALSTSFKDGIFPNYKNIIIKETENLKKIVTFINDIVSSDIRVNFYREFTEENKILTCTLEYNKEKDEILLKNDEDRNITFKYNQSLDKYCSEIKIDKFSFLPNEFKSFKITLMANPSSNNTFYKHLLIDRFSEEIINMGNNTKYYTYKIEMFSETKGLEVVQLPNISITQPLNFEKKKSVWEYLNMFVNMYSPKIKMVDDENKKTWKYVNKYKVSSMLKKDFENVYSPDFTLNNPNLRDVLSRLMLVKDMIPYVKDGFIFAMDITQRKKPFTYDPKYFNYVNCSLSSDNYCDNLKRTYSDSISQDNTCRRVEFLSFRNSSSALMTIDNMRLETGFPIYKINKVYMCYYKRMKITEESGSTSNKIMLCRQDITPVVKIDYETNFLNPNWMDFEEEFKEKGIENLDELAKYKFAVVSYSVGSKYITGWGTKYTYLPFTEGLLMTWFNKEKTYIENIFKFVDEKNPYGEISYDYLTANDIISIYPEFLEDDENLDNIPYFYDNDKGTEINTLKLKSFFFIVDYNAFFNGTVIHSKDDAKDNIVINDNVSSSLTILENDGLHQKEKINRFGNKGYRLNARYKDISEMQELGDVYYDDFDDDIIVYHREYSIFNNVINCQYFAMKDYVLKNYFTSVYAKHRTYNLMSYNESVKRAENNKLYFIFSKNKQYFENSSSNSYLEFKNFDSGAISKFFSFMKGNELDNKTGLIINNDIINSGYISHLGNNYACDVNAFVSGYSLCFNASMFDNVSAGVFMKVRAPKFDKNILDIDNLEGDYTGSLQDYYLLVDDEETGFVEKLGFYFSNINTENKLLTYLDLNNVKKAYNDFDNLPKININNYDRKNIIGKEFEINKDNKEVIDMTFQFEPITIDKNILFNQWMMKLSNLVTTYQKNNINKQKYFNNKFSKLSTNYTYAVSSDIMYDNILILRIKKDEFKSFKVGDSMILTECVFQFNTTGILPRRHEDTRPAIAFNSINIKEIKIREGDIFASEFNVSFYRAVSGGEFSLFELNTKSNYYELEKFNIKFVPYDIWEEERRCDETDFNSISEELNFNDFDYFIYEMDDVGIRGENNPSTQAIFFRRYGINTPPNSNYADYYFDPNYFHSASEGEILSTIGTSEINNINWSQNLFMLPKDKIEYFNKNMFLVASNKELHKTIVYDEFSTIDNIIDLLPEQVFSVKEEEKCIYVDINIIKQQGIDISNLNSIQQWYLDNGSYKFVFGVNINEEDISRGYIKIYLSMLSNRDLNVYDNYHNIIGTNYDYVANKDNKSSDWGQYYDSIENE